ncbi:MAG: hypothetical protein QOG94_3565 [Solirubrobacteraceae bacterium]|jgi:3-hydroxyisobutyrate dehydrogenase-like beta-hydroxyacid dehydrogenase|nr:hypothetical protein [Solirubrobacteraceae bacterium]MEA2137168.1 hypothetical protein [Solirubrobacteraceae bacterium]
MDLKLALNVVIGLEMQAPAEAVAFGVARGLPGRRSSDARPGVASAPT